MRHIISRTQSSRTLLQLRSRWLLRSEFLNRFVHGLRGIDHCHVPRIENDLRVRFGHQTSDSIHPRSSHAQWKRYNALDLEFT